MGCFKDPVEHKLEKKAPGSGVENSEPPVEIVPKAGVVLPNKEGVEAEPRTGADEEAPKA